jgi:hypothetical protein
VLIVEAVVAVIVIVGDRMWQRMPQDDPIAYQLAEKTAG